MDGRRRSNRILALGILASLVFHLVFAGWARSRPPRVLPANDTTELVFFEVKPPEPKPEPPKVEPPRPEPVKPAPPRPPAPKLAKVEPPAPPPPAAEPPASDVPRADSPRLDVPRAFADGTIPLPRASLYLTLDAGVEDEGGLHGLEASKDLAADTARESVARGKVARGMVHPYYAQLGKVLMKHWDADRAVSSTGLKGLTEQWAQNTKLWNEIWLEHAGQYGKSGRPLDAPPVDNRMVPGAPGAPIAMGDLQQRRQVAKAMGEQFKTSRRAEIRVTQNEEGKAIKVELIKPSNDEHVDKEAVIDVRAAAEQLPPPPPEALNGRKTLVSTWEFELIVSITPPVPTFSFEFDEVLGFVDTRMPLDRRIYKKVRLLAVE